MSDRAMKGGVVRAPVKSSRYPVIQKLIDARIAQNVARVDLAESTGYHVMILGRYERGETTPSLQRLTDWCNALGFELDIRPIEDAY